MSRPWFRLILRFFGALFVMALAGVGAGSVLVCIPEADLNSAPGLAFYLGFFVLTNLWRQLVFFSIWVAWLPPKRLRGWIILLSFAFLSGLAVSWRLQMLGAEGAPQYAGLPAWRIVRFISPVTLVSCLSTLSGISLAALIFRPWHSAQSELAP